MAANALMSAWSRLFSGAGRVPQMDAGNTANAPAAPPVQAGSYEYIQPAMFADQSILEIQAIPPGYRDWDYMAVDGYSISGLSGGGATGLVPQITQGAVFYFDPDTGQYLTLSEMPGA